MVAPPAGAGRNGHIASLRLLNKERWEAQLKEQQSTGNHLFNRPNPFDQGARDSPGAGFVQPYVRTKHPDRDGHRLGKMRGTVNWVNQDGKYVSEKKYATFKEADAKGGIRVDPANRLKYVPVYEDSMSIPIDASEKYRIPYTSVVNKVGDCKLFFCCGWRLTAAQWIWWLNFFCFAVHLTMVFVTFHFAYWQHGLSMLDHDHGDHMLVQIHRISMIPTPRMIELNQTSWGPGWNNSLGHTQFYIKDNHQMVNYATLVAIFFAISAFFHLGALIAGAFESCWFWYWRQLDDGFAWWRWIEYSGSASVMAMTIAISIGIREQNTLTYKPPVWQLAGIFMLHFCTMMYGLLVEYISVPKQMPDYNKYKNPVGEQQFDSWRKQLDAGGTNIRFQTDYRRDARALKLISQTEWEGDQPYADIQQWNEDAVKFNDPSLPEIKDKHVSAQRCNNYIRRMFPHVIGWFPMVAAWVIICNHLEETKRDLALITDRKIPDWVDAVIYGTVLIFWSFTAVQIIFENIPPGFFFGTELTYCALSLTAKLYLGWFVLLNVVTVSPDEGGAEGALQDSNNGAQAS